MNFVAISLSLLVFVGPVFLQSILLKLHKFTKQASNLESNSSNPCKSSKRPGVAQLQTDASVKHFDSCCQTQYKTLWNTKGNKVKKSW